MTKSITDSNATAAVKKKYWGSAQMKHDASAYTLLIIPIIGFFVFSLYPILAVVRYAWFRYTGVPSETAFVGFENFIKVLTQDKIFWGALGNSFLMAIYKIPIELPIALCAALALNRKLPGTSVFRNAFYLPYIISTAVIGVIFSNMFSYFGFANGLLQKLNLMAEPVDWFASKGTAFVVIIVASIWNSFGINTLYFLAALQNVPTELYESASLDGAGTFSKFIHVTIPGIAPILRVILLLSINGTLHTCDFILMLTNGAPAGKTEVVMTYLLKNITPGFTSNTNTGYGSAMALITAVILAVVSLIYMKASAKSSEV